MSLVVLRLRVALRLLLCDVACCGVFVVVCCFWCLVVVRCALFVFALLCSVSFVSCCRLGLTRRRFVFIVRCVSSLF